MTRDNGNKISQRFLITSKLLFIKVLLIHTTPNTAMVACPAEENKLALVTFAAVVLAKTMINPLRPA